MIADGSLISSPCFQTHLASGEVTNLSANNKTLQAEQVASVQAQFGINPYEPISNATVSTGQTYEPDVLGVSVFFFHAVCVFFFLSDPVFIF